jgi:uncharacterized membrane protein
MNPIILTKTAKFTLIGSASAFICFVGKFQPQVRLFFVYLYCGVVIILLLAALWEGRNLVSGELSEDTLNNLMPSLMQGKQKRQYLLSPNVRLELAIGLVTVTIAALVGAL